MIDRAGDQQPVMSIGLMDFRWLCMVISVLGLTACDSPETENTAANTPASAVTTEASEIPTGRLPESVEPNHYRLSLTIDPRQTHFSGHVEIDVRLDRPTQSLWIHGHQIDVSHAVAELVFDSGHNATGRSTCHCRGIQ